MDDARTEQTGNLASYHEKKVESELADVAIYLLSFADKAGVDLEKAIMNKLKINMERFPIDQSMLDTTDDLISWAIRKTD